MLLHRKLLLVLLSISAPVFAECVLDMSGQNICGQGECKKGLRGDVFCAPHRHGTAMMDGHGNVVCGYGECAKDLYGKVYCSTEYGGTAQPNDRTGVDCYGACELASTELCERTLAGSSPER